MMTEDEFFDRIAAGEPVSAVCKAKGAPFSSSTFYRKIVTDADLWDKYARAKEAAQHAAVEEMRELAKAATGENYQQKRLEIDVIKWQASKLARKTYGDKLAVGGDDGLDPIRIEDAAAGRAKLKAVLIAKHGGADSGASDE